MLNESKGGHKKTVKTHSSKQKYKLFIQSVESAIYLFGEQATDFWIISDLILQKSSTKKNAITE